MARTHRQARSLSSASHFPFFRLPAELRLKIYRYAFSIYPSARARVIAAPLGPNGKWVRTFEIYSHSNPPKTTQYNDDFVRGYLSAEDQERRGEYRYPCQQLLFPLLVSRAVYEEAMPLFYSETFFSKNEMWSATCFLRGIGRQRRKFIRRLSIEFSSSSIHQGGGSENDMTLLVDQLIEAEKVDTLEIALPPATENDICVYMHEYVYVRKYLTAPYSPSSSYLATFDGLDKLSRLGSLGSLRLVGKWRAHMVENEERLRWLEKFGEEREQRGLTRTVIVFELPQE